MNDVARLRALMSRPLTEDEARELAALILSVCDQLEAAQAKIDRLEAERMPEAGFGWSPDH